MNKQNTVFFHFYVNQIQLGLPELQKILRDIQNTGEDIFIENCIRLLPFIIRFNLCTNNTKERIFKRKITTLYIKKNYEFYRCGSFVLATTQQ